MALQETNHEENTEKEKKHHFFLKQTQEWANIGTKCKGQGRKGKHHFTTEHGGDGFVLSTHK